MIVRMIAKPTSPSLLGTTQDELLAMFAEWGETAYRAKQVVEWVYRRRVTSFDEMTNLSLDLRTRLAEQFSLRTTTVSSVTGSHDTTRKYLLRLHDGRFVETVLIPASPALYGDRADRRTLCVSSQVGCA